MAFIDDVLQEPSYGWQNSEGELVVPTKKQLFGEAFRRINIFTDKRNWISMMSWLMAVMMLPFLYFFITEYFTWYLVPVFLFYAMIVMGTHGTIWFHRYCTHKAYTFAHPIFRFITQNLVLKTFPEEIYVVSHHVHHVKSDMPGDPYNPRGGFWYCMLSDVNHQSLNKTLDEKNYNRAAHFMKHTGISINTYEQYKKRGSIVTPMYAVLSWVLNWAFWYGVFYLVGGHALATTLFSAALAWFILVRAFNYTGHGKGKEMHKDGVDFDRSNLSINQLRPGLFAGEWHNNHHLYPGSARAGFLSYQLDLAWIYIYCLHKVGAVTSYHNSHKDFLRKHYSNKPLNLKTVEEPAIQAIAEPLEVRS